MAAPDRMLSDEEIRAAVDTVAGLARAAGATIWDEGGDSAQLGSLMRIWSAEVAIASY